MVPNCVLASDKALNVAQGYASGFSSAAALLDDHFEHPLKQGVMTNEIKRIA